MEKKSDKLLKLRFGQTSKWTLWSNPRSLAFFCAAFCFINPRSWKVELRANEAASFFAPTGKVWEMCPFCLHFVVEAENQSGLTNTSILFKKSLKLAPKSIQKYNFSSPLWSKVQARGQINLRPFGFCKMKIYVDTCHWRAAAGMQNFAQKFADFTLARNFGKMHSATF